MSMQAVQGFVLDIQEFRARPNRPVAEPHPPPEYTHQQMWRDDSVERLDIILPTPIEAPPIVERPIGEIIRTVA